MAFGFDWNECSPSVGNNVHLRSESLFSLPRITQLRQIYDTEVDLVPDLGNKILTVRLHHLTHAAHDDAVRHLCDQLNATATIFPDTELKLVYQLGAS